MKEKKRRLEFFSFYDRSGLECHLAKMAEEGWLLEKIGQFVWTYRRIEPRTLTFSVCYFPKASPFDPEPSEEQETFYDFCEHTGWILAAANAQLQVFYNERENPVPIETDPMAELDAIHRTMKRSFLPTQLILLVLAVVNEGLFISRLLDNPIGVLASPVNLTVGLCWVLEILLTGVESVGYFLWHRRAVRAAERGEFLETKSHRRFQIASLILLGVWMVYFLLSVFTSGDQKMIVILMIMFCVYTPGLFLLTNGVRNFLKRRKTPRRFNMVVTIVTILVAAYGFMGVMVFGMLFSSDRGWFAGDKETYQYHGMTFTADWDELPLTVEDLLDVHYDGYIRRRQVDESFLLAKFEMEQRPRLDAVDFKKMPELDYTIVLVKFPALYGVCRDALLNQWDDDWYWDLSYVPVDAAPWGAVEAYQEKDEEYGLRSQYLLCYSDRIVEIRFLPGSPDWNITPELTALVGERLG